MEDEKILEELVRVSRRTAELGYVVAGEGNTSARSSEKDAFWIKRSGCHLGEVASEDFVQIDLRGALKDLGKPLQSVRYKAKKGYRASIEVAMHALIYASQEGVNFVIHSHPPCTLAGCCTKGPRDFFVPQFPDSVVYLGLPGKNWIFLDYATPGRGLGELLKEALEAREDELRVVILAKHGAVTVGKTAVEALARCQMLEKSSYVRLMSLMAGRATTLSGDEMGAIDRLESEKYRQRVLRGEL